MITPILLLVAPMPAVAADALLPTTPDGWRYERMDLPLDFAPDLGFAGFEELRFAPGMFDPEAPDYFTYAFAIELEDDVVVDEPFLTSFFDRYYRGLCAAVAESRELELDLERVGTAVAFDGSDWIVSARLFDAFGTGEPLTLRLEVSVHAGARTTELLGLASPAATDAALWSELRALRTAWREARPVPVQLNHLFVVVDRETYAALAGSELLRSLGPSEERTTVRPDMSYGGLYVYGTHTYFEILDPERTPMFPEGSSAVAFGIEVAGGTQRVSATLGEHGVKTFVGERQRPLEGAAPVPWFHIMGVEQAHATSKVSAFSLEYVPEFLARWHADRHAFLTGISRRNVLARYAAHLDQDTLRAQGPLGDLTEVRLELDERERKRWLDLCRGFGWEVEDDEDAGEWMCDGPGVRLHVRSSGGPGRVTGWTMSLRRPLEADEIELGKAVLRVSGDRATLTIRP